MHKKVPVLDFELDQEVDAIVKILTVHNAEHIPVGVGFENGVVNRKALNNWWLSRTIPASRSGLQEALELLQVCSTRVLLEKCFALGLSDQYWVNRPSNPLQWEDINFFDNEFSEDVGDALFGKEPKGKPHLVSPDNTSDGWLKKKWIIQNGKRILLKGGSGPYYQEPLNEVLASLIMKRLSIRHVEYTYSFINDFPISACEDFIDTQTELISAWNILFTSKKRLNHISIYEHFLESCESLGIANARADLENMLVTDFLIANVDRHFNNFGAVRNADTLEWIGIAPIFDCGTSFWYNEYAHSIKPEYKIPSKPFKGDHTEQIKLVENFDRFNFDALLNIDDEFYEIFKPSQFMETGRAKTLLHSLKIRIKMLR